MNQKVQFKDAGIEYIVCDTPLDDTYLQLSGPGLRASATGHCSEGRGGHQDVWDALLRRVTVAASKN